MWNQAAVSLQMLNVEEALTFFEFTYVNLENSETFAVMFLH